MTPQEALDYLDALAASAPLNRQGHARAIDARQIIGAALVREQAYRDEEIHTEMEEDA
jgi:hypothetical protein